MKTKVHWFRYRLNTHVVFQASDGTMALYIQKGLSCNSAKVTLRGK